MKKSKIINHLFFLLRFLVGSFAISCLISIIVVTILAVTYSRVIFEPNGIIVLIEFGIVFLAFLFAPFFYNEIKKNKLKLKTPMVFSVIITYVSIVICFYITNSVHNGILYMDFFFLNMLIIISMFNFIVLPIAIYLVIETIRKKIYSSYIEKLMIKYP